jgi:hypothetical protein
MESRAVWSPCKYCHCYSNWRRLHQHKPTSCINFSLYTKEYLPLKHTVSSSSPPFVTFPLYSCLPLSLLSLFVHQWKRTFQVSRVRLHITELCLSFHKTANAALRDVAHSLHRGILYFQNGTWFHATRVKWSSITAVREVQPSSRQFPRRSKCSSLMPHFARIGK